jgi:hypothetical protein
MTNWQYLLESTSGTYVHKFLGLAQSMDEITPDKIPCADHHRAQPPNAHSAGSLFIGRALAFRRSCSTPARIRTRIANECPDVVISQRAVQHCEAEPAAKRE